MRRTTAMILTALLVFTGCFSNRSEPSSDSTNDEVTAEPTEDPADETLVQELRETVNQLELTSIGTPPAQDAAKVELGHNLFFDPILSGSRDISCATCHQMSHGTSDEFALSAGPGFRFTEYKERRPGPQHGLTPRTSPGVFDRGHEEFKKLFWDGRLEKLDDGRIVIHDVNHSRQKDGGYFRIMSDEFDNLLAAQATLPVHSRDEMRGVAGERDAFGDFNEVAPVAKHDLEGTWRRLMDRLREIDAYRELFSEAYPDRDIDELEFPHVGNALAAFQIEHFSFSDSPWDRFLDGEDQALSSAQARGAQLFYGDAGCSNCHGGKLMTDQQLYNIAVPPMTTGHYDFDNMDTGAALRSHAGFEQSFHFTTPPLRNVELTGPYMHNGAYETLEDVIRHKMDPVEGLWNFDSSHLSPIFRAQVHTQEKELNRVEKFLSDEALNVPKLDDDEVDDLVAFLHSLTSPSATDLTHLVPDTVPSELPLNLPVPQ